MRKYITKHQARKSLYVFGGVFYQVREVVIDGYAYYFIKHNILTQTKYKAFRNFESLKNHFYSKEKEMLIKNAKDRAIKAMERFDKFLERK